MSDDSTRPDRSGSKAGWIAGAVVGLLVIGLVLFFLRNRNDADVVITPAPTVVASPTASETETADPTEAPTTEAPTESPPAEPSPEPTGSAEASPTSEDVADFVAAHGPADRTATGDVTGDAVDEVVLASIRNNAVAIQVGLWDGSEFQRAFRDEGGPAERLTGLEVTDYNRRPGAEIVTEQRAGAEGRSISVWGGDKGAIARQEGKGGCWNGFHTYGISGATIAPGQITATCDGSPQPPEAWSSDVYEWKSGRWTFVRTQEASG